MPKYVGSFAAKLCFVAMALVVGFTWKFGQTDFVSAHPWLVWGGEGVALVLAFVHSSVPLYRGWMAGALILNRVMTTAIFGALYLTVIPLFALPRKLMKRTSKSTNFWAPRRDTVYDQAWFERLG